jgi:hypothetical protein
MERGENGYVDGGGGVAVLAFPRYLTSLSLLCFTLMFDVGSAADVCWLFRD